VHHFLQARSSAGEGDGQEVRTISGDYYASLPAILRTRTGGTLEVCVLSTVSAAACFCRNDGQCVPLLELSLPFQVPLCTLLCLIAWNAAVEHTHP